MDACRFTLVTSQLQRRSHRNMGSLTRFLTKQIFLFLFVHDHRSSCTYTMWSNYNSKLFNVWNISLHRNVCHDVGRCPKKPFMTLFIFHFTLYHISFSTSHFILLAISLSTSSRCEMPCVKPRASHTVTNGMGVVPFSGEGSIDDQRHHIATPLLLLWLYFPSFSYFNLSQLFIIYPSLVFISYGCQHYANPNPTAPVEPVAVEN